MRKWAHEAWGRPDPEAARHLAATVIPTTNVSFASSAATQTAQHYLEVLDKIGLNERTEKVLPTSEALEHYGGLLREMFQPTIDHAFEGVEAESFSEEEAAPIFERIAEHLGLLDAGWSIEVDKDRNLMSVSAKKKKVYIGKRPEPYRREDIERLALHEIFIHAMRSKRGEDLGSYILQYGAAGNLEFEEGLTGYCEAAWKGRVEDMNPRRRYIVGSYAQGVIDGQPHNFLETYRFALGYALLASGKKNLDQASIDKISSSIYDTTLRAFRGIEPSLIGVNDLALCTYYNGSLKAVEFFDPGQRGNYLSREQLEFLLQGKFDATNPDQSEYAAQKLRQKRSGDS
jgi:hypothetical protein